jgi:hyperosmotically inducible protein
VKGVQAIAQEIDVRYPDEKKTADDEIAKRAVDILRWNAVVPRDRVQIMVHLGWVTLAGEVDWQYQRAAAEDEIRRLSGVAKIVNNITIKPRVQPADVRNRIEAAFRRHASIDADRVHVAILNGGTAKLEGSVHDWSERTAAEHAAWSAPGVVEVDNRLTVS